MATANSLSCEARRSLENPGRFRQQDFSDEVRKGVKEEVRKSQCRVEEENPQSNRQTPRSASHPRARTRTKAASLRATMLIFDEICQPA